MTQYQKNSLTLSYDSDRVKKSLHQKIDNLNDPDYLEILDKMISNNDKAFVIPDNHLADILQGEQDSKNGVFLTMEELEKRYEKWLKD